MIEVINVKPVGDNIFLSQPMTNASKEDVLTMREKMKKWLYHMDGSKRTFNFISTYEAELPEGETQLWYLGNAIQQLSKCDCVLFAPNWRESRGCTIEHHVCEIYNIPYIELPPLENL